MGALYFGVGKAAGSLVGGLLIETVGVRNTFRAFSVAAMVAASVYLLFTTLWDKRNKVGISHAGHRPPAGWSVMTKNIRKKSMYTNTRQVGEGKTGGDKEAEKAQAAAVTTKALVINIPTEALTDPVEKGESRCT